MANGNTQSGGDVLGSLSVSHKLIVTVATFIVLGTLGWTGYNTSKTAIAVEVLSEKILLVQAATSHISDLVKKDLNFLEARLTQIDDRFVNISSRIRILEEGLSNKTIDIKVIEGEVKEIKDFLSQRKDLVEDRFSTIWPRLRNIENQIVNFKRLVAIDDKDVRTTQKD